MSYNLVLSIIVGLLLFAALFYLLYLYLVNRIARILIYLQINQMKWVTFQEIYEETNVLKTLTSYVLVELLKEHSLQAKDQNGDFYENSKVWYVDDIVNDLEVQLKKQPPKRRQSKKKISFLDILLKPHPVPA